MRCGDIRWFIVVLVSGQESMRKRSEHIRRAHPAFEDMRLAVEALATGCGSIHDRLIAAERHFGVAFEDGRMQTRGERILRLGIGAGLVEGGEESDEDDDEDDEGDIAESIRLLDEARAAELAGDVLRLYELVAGIRSDNDWGAPRPRGQAV